MPMAPLTQAQLLLLHSVPAWWRLSWPLRGCLGALGSPAVMRPFTAVGEPATMHSGGTAGEEAKSWGFWLVGLSQAFL